jgi:myo-inositol 2-dehydrogenase/D-chiro-inositol 1-dehydrogenase
MISSPLRIGIAGVGRMGRHRAANLAQRVLGAELVAACSPVADDLARARDALGVAHVYGEYTRLWAHPRLDAVFLATPTTLHADQIIEGLRAGRTCSRRSRSR